MHLCRSSSNVPCLPSFLEMLQNPHVLLTFDKVHCACHAKRHLNLQKWREHVVFCTFLTSKCASRHNGVHFFDISTSKSVRTSGVFSFFHLQMCFAHLRATTACTFSTSQLPKVIREWCVLYILRATTACNCSSLIWPDGSAPAALASLLFDPPAPQITGKTQCSATFLPFRASASSFF